MQCENGVTNYAIEVNQDGVSTSIISAEDLNCSDESVPIEGNSVVDDGSEVPGEFVYAYQIVMTVDMISVTLTGRFEGSKLHVLQDGFQALA